MVVAAIDGVEYVIIKTVESVAMDILASVHHRKLFSLSNFNLETIVFGTCLLSPCKRFLVSFKFISEIKQDHNQ